MSTYKIQIKTASGYETNCTKSTLVSASRVSRDLAAAGYDGRIVTSKGRVSQEWTIQR